MGNNAFIMVLKKLLFIISTLLCLIGIFYSCKKENALPPVEPESDTLISYKNDVQPIFNTYCISCHSQTNAQGGLDLSSYEALMQGGVSGQVVKPGEADSSLLILKIDGTMYHMGGELTDTVKLNIIKKMDKSRCKK
ncbi:MAG: hypothetical protein QMD71_07560 [bacterium]|nr:hypothetical protein [bacterium]